MSCNCGILHNFVVGFFWFLFLFPSYVPAHHHPQVYLECLELRNLKFTTSTHRVLLKRTFFFLLLSWSPFHWLTCSFKICTFFLYMQFVLSFHRRLSNPSTLIIFAALFDIVAREVLSLQYLSTLPDGNRGIFQYLWINLISPGSESFLRVTDKGSWPYYQHNDSSEYCM